MLAIAAIGALAAFQLGTPADNVTRAAQELYGKARMQYESGKKLEQSRNIGGALAAYQKALGDLSTPLPREGLITGVDPSGNLTPDTGTPTPENSYPTAAVLASSIALDQARLSRLYGLDFMQYLNTAEDEARYIFDREIKPDCSNAPTGSGRIFLPSWKGNPPAPIHQAAAYFNLGMAQLFENHIDNAKNCFSKAHLIDPTNVEILRQSAALVDISDDCTECLPADLKDLVKTGVSIGAALAAKEYPLAAPITAAILNYFIGNIPNRPKH